MWIFISLACLMLAIVGVVAFSRSRRGSLYVFRNDGFTAYSMGGESPAHRADEAGLLKAVRRLLPSDVYDTLWVSRTDDRYAGIIVTIKAGTPILTVIFKTAGEEAKRKSFAEAMAALGYTGSENSDGFNGGTGEQFRVTRVEYSLPKAPEDSVAAIKAALANLDPSAGNEYFLSGSDISKIVGSRPGVKFVPYEDPLQDLR